MGEALELLVERNVRTPMRDGVELAADIWRPAAGGPFPVLVIRTPYGRTMMSAMAPPDTLAQAGFAVVVQDCRGRFDSDGEWAYVHADVDDGYDTIEWAAAQPWSNGRVSAFGILLTWATPGSSRRSAGRCTIGR